MATVNFSVPDEVKQAFDAAFAGRNKSAILAGLMRRAVAEQELQRRRQELFDQLMDLRKAHLAGAPAATSATLRRSRRRGRP